ncbi:hypothetical protein EV178_003460 [Coemansia sp. RSA 1646]|nr:hypothetical protein EV178_003460 [Coemansia sp. RSA 1646]KAJ1769310.1 hypothetical protein LPJ74_004137 [Coemansia sp. RSA 1843]KAJ2215624.1 hypothetical protein EV179_002035 [Coemansia sp. RSA 487]
MSPAIQRTIDKVEERNHAFDIVKEIERYRFTAVDIFAMLPEHIAGTRRADAPVDAACVGTASRGEVLEEMQHVRNKRAAEIAHAFTAKQLQEYLRVHNMPSTGTKAVLVSRIIQTVWRMTTDTVTSWFDEAHKQTEDEGMSMELGESALDQLNALDPRIVADIEKDHSVKVKIDAETSRIDVVGKRADARVALSNLREILTASATVEVDLPQYGTPRELSQRQMQRIVRVIGKTGVGRARSNITYREGELFVNGIERLDVRDTCDALVQATIEPAQSTAFVVAPGALQMSACTVVPAVDMFSMRPTTVATRKLFATGEKSTPDREAAYAKHSVFRKKPLGPIELARHTYTGSMLLAWAKDQLQMLDRPGATISAKLGNVMVDFDATHAGVHKRFCETAELMASLSTWAPLFAFASHVSHLDWFRRSPVKDVPKSKRDLVLKFARIKEPSSKEAAQRSASKSVLPAYEEDTITATISVSDGKLKFGHAQLERSRCEPTAEIAFLQARYDVQLSVRSPMPISTTRGIVDALKDVSHKLGLSGNSGAKPAMRRHHPIHLPQGTFGLQRADLVGTKYSRLTNGYLLLEHQVWNLIDDQLYNEAEVVPLATSNDLETKDAATLEHLLGNEGDWTSFVMYLFEMAYGRQLTPVPESTELFV